VEISGSQGTKPLIVASVYLTPDSTKSLFLNNLSSLLASPALQGKNVIITGDFNINWNITSANKTLIENTLLSFGLHQHSVGVTFISHLGNESLLDHNYVSKDLTVQQCKILTCDRQVSDHYATYLVVNNFQPERLPRKIIQTRSFHNLNAQTFHESASKLPLLSLVNDKSLSLHERVLKFESHINYLLELHLPLNKIRVRGPKKPWLTKDLLRLISIKNKYYKKIYQRVPVTANQIQYYRKFKNYVLSQIRKSKKTYYSNKISESTQSFFRCLRHFTGKNKNQTHIECLKYNGSTLSSEADIAHAMNQFFTNIPGKITPGPSDSPISPGLDLPHTENNNTHLKFHRVSCETVHQQILKLSPHKRGGIEEVPAFVYQIISDLIALPISILINESLDTCTFPDCLKIALVTPIYKKGDQSEPSNYRPISSLPILSKLFETNIKIQLMSFLEDQRLLSPRQFGYRPNHSSEQLITTLLQDWRSKLDCKQPCFISSLSLDVKKTFDSINHDILVSKLSNYRLSKSVIQLLTSYLSCRYQVMKIDSTKSSLLPVICGVPQGSILGPVLFLLAINELLTVFPTSYAYADDTLIYAGGSTIDQSVARCENLLHQVQNWYQKNCLQLNFSKIQFCTFSNRSVSDAHSITINSTEIRPSNTLTLLGVTLDSSLSFNPHVTNLVSKASKLIYLTSKFRKYLNVEQALKAYTAIVRPSLEYCPSILLDTTQKNLALLEGAQNRAIRIIVSAPRQFSVTSGRLLLNLPTLASRRRYLFAKFIKYKLSKFKASNLLLELLKNSSSHNLSLRRKHTYIKPCYRTHFGRGSFLNQHHIFLSDNHPSPRDYLSFQV
jgi:hypothetical protein